MARSAPYGQTYLGMTWDPASGSYVSPTSKSTTNATNATNDANATIATGTAAGTYHAPMTSAEQAASQLGLSQLAAQTERDRGTLAETSRSNQATEGLTAREQAARAAAEAASLGETTREATANEGLASSKFEQTKTDRANALAALEKIWSGVPGGPTGGGGASTHGPVLDGGLLASGGGGTGMATAPGPTSVDYASGMAPGASAGLGGGGGSLADQAEQAALTTAKERGGERLSASLRGLHEQMAGRGVGGSGIEARNTRDLVGANLGDQNDVERGIIQGKAQRANDVADWTRNRAAGVEDRNFAAQQEANKQRIQALLATYGMTY